MRRDQAFDNDGLPTGLKRRGSLSACNIAAADGTLDIGGLSGLARAFFYAGAR